MRSPNTLILTALLALSVATATTAQVAHVLASGAGLTTADKVYLPSPANPFGRSAGLTDLPEFYAAVHPAQVGIHAFAGGIAADQVARRFICTDGVNIWQEAMTEFSPAGTPSSVRPSPMMTAMGPAIITGLSAHRPTNRLFMCDENGFEVRDMAAPYALQKPRINLPAPHSQLTGMSYDPADDTLWFCDSQNFVYHTDINGNPISGEYPINLVDATGLLRGICVDRSSGNGAFPTIYRPTPLGPMAENRYHVWVTDGSNVYEAKSDALIINVGVSSSAYGLAFSADGQFTAGATPTPSPVATLRQDAPSLQGRATDLLFECNRPNRQWYLLIDLYPTAPIALMGGQVHVHNLLLTMPNTDSAGRSNFVVPASLPVGFSVSFQALWNRFPGSFFPLWALTDCLTLMQAMP